MATEKFSIQEFDSAMTSALKGTGLVWEHSGYFGGEMRYGIQVKKDPVVWVLVNSSIQRDGYAADTGENSIRVWMVDDDGAPLGNKTQAYITRVPGWQERLANTLADVIDMANAVDYCPVCQDIQKVFVAKQGDNRGRAFRKCGSGCVFQWLDEIDDESPTCPKCGSDMQQKTGKYGEFWSCVRFPSCKGTRNIDDTTREKAMKRFSRIERELDAPKEERQGTITFAIKAEPKPAKPKKFEPSKYQKAIFQEVELGQPGTHVVIEAGAGSGKTTTGVEMVKLLHPSTRTVFTAFNKHIAKEMDARAPKHVKATTTHSLGFSACRQNIEGMTFESVNNDKVKIIFKNVLDWEIHKHIFPTVEKLVSLVKANLVEPTDEELDALADHYGIVLNGDRDIIFETVATIVELAKTNTTIIDFDDMVWLPVVLNFPCPTYDFIFADEAQDLNKAQIELILRHAQNGSRVFCVGDRYQSMYGFRGADAKAIPNIIERLDAKTLPLSITYRCPKVVVDFVNERFPEIPFEAPEWAQEGVIRDTSSLDREDLHAGDMVLCRTNAPLVSPAFALIRRGVKAVIVGRDIGKGLISLIKKYDKGNLPLTLSALNQYYHSEYDKLIHAEKKSQAQALQDKVDTIFAVADGCFTVDEVISKILDVFRDDVEGVAFSTVHRAKGLEAERVYILKPELLPHPMAESDWELEQERNIEYVAYTRTKRELVFVRD